MSELTQVEMDFTEIVPYELGRIADALEKLNEVQAGTPEKEKTPVQLEPPIKEEHPKDGEFDVLAVTNVQVFPFKEGINLGHMKGMASVVLNDQLQLRGLKIMKDENGLYVGYPIDPFYKGEDLRSVCFPVTRQLREHIENCVLEKYEEATK